MNRLLVQEWLDRAARYERAAREWPLESYWHQQGMADAKRSLRIADQLQSEPSSITPPAHRNRGERAIEEGETG